MDFVFRFSCDLDVGMCQGHFSAGLWLDYFIMEYLWKMKV